MSDNSNMIKRFSVAICAAAIGLAISVKDPVALHYGSFLILIMSFLDCQYFRIERSYRNLYNNVRSLSALSESNLSLDIINKEPFISCYLRWPIFLFYGALIGFLSSVYLIH